MKTPVFYGACTAVITPFRRGEIDFERLKRQLERQISGGVSAIVAAGTTGECATLEESEYERLVEFCVRHGDGRIKVIAGIGGNHTWHCVRRAEFAQRAGADALLMTTPYYNKTTQAGLLAHFLTVANRCGLPLILYNVPSRTGIGIGAETYKALAEHPNINGVKEASGDLSLIARIAAECGDALHIWSGNDDNTLPLMALGAKGVVSVASNLVPEAVVKLCKLGLTRQTDEALILYRRYAALFRLLFAETNPIPIKAAMALCGTDSGELRLPLVPMSPQNLSALRDCMEALQLLPFGNE